MAESERVLLNHYNLPSLDLETWPVEHDVSSSDEDQGSPRTATANLVRRSRSRYSILDRSASYRSSVLSAEKSGVGNLVQKDEPDPLGDSASVVQALRQRGLPVEEDLKLRNRFLLSSTTFSPALFLAQVHSEDSTDNLLRGLDFLSRSIEKKSASLKVLVESNFERFVRAKATIDNVYTEMREQGREPESVRRHSRHASKYSAHLGASNSYPGDKRKNALVKESEYGVQGIKTPLLEVAVKAQEVWGPALGGREKEESLRALLTYVEKNRGLFEAGLSIQECIKRKDHELLVEEYTRAHRYADDARSLVDSAITSGRPLTDPEIHQVVVTARMWTDVEGQVTAFKRDVWRRLAGTHFAKHSSGEEDKSEEHMELINILLELGVEDNPIWVWLLSRYDFLKNKITATSERSKVEIEVLRRHLANTDKATIKMLAFHLRMAANQGRGGNASMTDSPQVLEFWDHVQGTLHALLSSKGGILGEVIEFWETAQSFIDGKAQMKLPVGIDGQSRQHHRLSSDGVRDLRTGAMELVNLIREHISTFFSDPPIENISLLVSPIPSAPETPKTPLSASFLSPLSDTRFKFDVNNIPPPSPRTGEMWEKYAFWPPYGNALSGVQYLSRILVLVGTAASEMASLSCMRESLRPGEQLKSMVGGVRERCVQAVCAAWNNDSENCRSLEDWTRSLERRDLTNMPSRFMKLEESLLTSMQKILYVSEAMNRPGSGDVVLPPSAKLLQMVRSQFVASLYKILSGMVENAESLKKLNDDAWRDDIDGLTAPARSGVSADNNIGTIDATNRNVRMLLTLSNLQALRNEIVPQLISQFETNFSVKLTEESNTIRDVLSQIDIRLFQAYVKPISQELSTVVYDGIGSPSWAPVHRPTDARPYVYDVLLRLVIVHTEVSTTAAPLTSLILKYLLEQLCLSLIEALKRRPEYSLPALMQATLDVEFIAQTLKMYTTDKASETQSAIYLALDERTDSDARMKLQTELSELRSILKRLREQTKGEFACFRRPRTHTKSDRPTSQA